MKKGYVSPVLLLGRNKKKEEPPKEYIDGYIWCDKNQNNFTDGVLRYGQNEIFALLNFTQYAIGKEATIEIFNKNYRVSSLKIKVTKKKILLNINEDLIFRSCEYNTNNFHLRIYCENQRFIPKEEYLNMNLKIHFVVLIPGIMKKMKWQLARKSQIEWFEGKANNYPWESEPKLNYFTLGGLMHFDRFKEFFEEHKEDWKTDKAIGVLKNEIKKMQKDKLINYPTANNPTIEFGTFSGEIINKTITPDEYKDQPVKTVIERMPLFEKYYFQYASYEESKYNKLDDFFGAIANCNLHFCAKGFLHYNSGNIKVEIKKIAVYVKDGFDFAGDQPLGNWSYKNQDAYKLMSGVTINNKSYRDYRKDIKMGQDCYRYSNLYIYDVNYDIFELN